MRVPSALFGGGGGGVFPLPALLMNPQAVDVDIRPAVGLLESDEGFGAHGGAATTEMVAILFGLCNNGDMCNASHLLINYAIFISPQENSLNQASLICRLKEAEEIVPRLNRSLQPFDLLPHSFQRVLLLNC